MLTASEVFLAVIDVQGKLAEIVADSERMRRNVRILIEGAELLGVPVVATEQAPAKLGPTVPEIVAALGGPPTLRKTAFSCLGEPSMREAFAATGRREVLVAGIEAHVCVYQTVRDLLDAGYGVHVVTDAVSSRDPANRETAISRMVEEGARRTSVEMVLFELQRTCEGDRFREISRRVK